MRATTIDLYFVLIREIVRGIKARIECGNETPIMRRILRTIVRSNERLIEVTQEIKSYTPPPFVINRRRHCIWKFKLFNKAQELDRAAWSHTARVHIKVFKSLELEWGACSHATRANLTNSSTVIKRRRQWVWKLIIFKFF